MCVLTISFSYFYVSVMQSSLLVGGPGTAKTSMVNQFLSRFSPDDSCSKTITFSYLTTPGIFQTAIEVRDQSQM